MKRIKMTAIAGATSVILFGMTSQLMAFTFGGGVSGGVGYGEVSGTEKLKSSGQETSATEGGVGVMPAIYATIGTDNGWRLGVEYVLGQVKWSNESRDITDLLAAEKSVVGDNQAEATAEDFRTYFIETPGFSPLGIYLKAGYSEFDVTTAEDLSTGGKYGDEDGSGHSYGIGFKGGDPAGGFETRLEMLYTDYSTMTFTNGEDSTGDTTIDADIETWNASFKIGYNF